MATFLDRIANRSATVGVLGLGYVGIPLSLTIASSGLKVIGFDIDRARIDEIASGQSPIKHISPSQISSLLNSGFEATTDFARASECDALIICVPTPLGRHREPDLSFVVSTMDSIAPYLRAHQLVALESTTWPGTTEEILSPYFERRGLKLGEDAFLVYSPEREDPGNLKYETSSIPKIVGGFTPECQRIGQAFYEIFIEKIIPVSSSRAAELVKLLENIHRSVNIGLMNEMKVIAERMGLDIFEIVNAAATKPFGFTPYYPGPGVGGHCIPIDPFYMTWKAREYGLHTRFIELAGEINAGMPDYVVARLAHALNLNGTAINGSNVLALGIAYKRDVDDMRESPSVFVMERLREQGARISYSDPNVPHFPQMRDHNFSLSSIDLTPDSLSKFDAVIILTDHNSFDYEMILRSSRLIVDTRGRYMGYADKKIYRA